MSIGGDFTVPMRPWSASRCSTQHLSVDHDVDSPSVYAPWTMTSALPMSRLRPGGRPRFGTVRRGRQLRWEDTCHEGNIPLVPLRKTFEQAHGPDESG